MEVRYQTINGTVDPNDMPSKLISDCIKIASEYDQEIPQSQTADNPWQREEKPHTTHETPGTQTKQSSQFSPLHLDDCKTRMDIK